MVRNQPPDAESLGRKGSSRAGRNPLREHFTHAIAVAAIAIRIGHVSGARNPSHDLDRPLFGR